MINKKQLVESIMAGVKRSFRENKSLNEGFSQWREQNVPRVDYKKVNTVVDYISDVFNKLCKQKQLMKISLVFHNTKSASWSTVNTLDNLSGNDVKNDIKTMLDSGIVTFKNEWCNGDEDKFVAGINELYIKITMSKQSHLYKYITSTIDPGSNKIKNMSYITLVKVDDNNIALRFSLQTLLNESADILEYFS